MCFMFYFAYVGVMMQGLAAATGKERIDFKPYCLSPLTKVCATCKMMTENPLES